MATKMTITTIMWDIYVIFSIAASLGALAFMAVSVWYIRAALEHDPNS